MMRMAFHLDADLMRINDKVCSVFFIVKDSSYKGWGTGEFDVDETLLER